MSEVAAETQAPETEAGEQQETPKPKPTETVEFWKQKAREQEARAKANAEAATKLQQFEDRDKTEAQKLTERAEAAERSVPPRSRARAIAARGRGREGSHPGAGETPGRRDPRSSWRPTLTNCSQRSSRPPTDEPVVPSLDLGTRGGAPMPLNGDPLERALRNSLGIT